MELVYGEEYDRVVDAYSREKSGAELGQGEEGSIDNWKCGIALSACQKKFVKEPSNKMPIRWSSRAIARIETSK
ncbi:MAG: hypothetical protein MZV64_00300 [Ignavibacteriales bacterium]|nr:hypothetical protein [Ignavibacteriales bacterium]